MNDRMNDRILLPLYLCTVAVHVQHATRSSAHTFTLDAVDEETHGVTVSNHDDSHMFYFDRLAGRPLQLVEPSIMPELPQTQ